MNPIDAALAVAGVAALVGGWRLGFARRALSWLGIVVGLAAASALLGIIGQSTPDTGALLRAIAALFVGGTIGNLIGHWLGGRLRSMMEDTPLGAIDSLGGSLIGVASVFLTAWMVLPTMTQVPGWPAEAARSSVVAGRLTRTLGTPPDLLSGLSRSLGLDAMIDLIPDIDLGGLTPEAPLSSPLDDAVTSAAVRSTVRIQSQGCGMVSSGSGVVVAPGIVVTNAHVVAGGSEFTLTNDGDLSEPAELRAIDALADVAVLASPGLALEPLPVVNTNEAGTGAIFGYPGGGALAISPYQITTVRTVPSTDIYGEGRADRSIAVVGSRISPGVSGGPLVNQQGEVEGLAFGVAPDNEQLAYAVPSSDVLRVLSVAAASAVPSGACTR